MQEARDIRRLLAPRGEEALAALAARQHGVISIAQLRAHGVDIDAVQWRLRRGRLHRIHRGVYALGHPRIGGRGHLWAAVLAVPGGVLSHRSAAAAWDLCAIPSGLLDVTTTTRSRSTSRIRVHHTTEPEATQQEDGLPLTTPMRTLRDIAATDPRRLERLCARAEHHRLLDTATLTSQTSRRGARRLRAALSAMAPGATRSDLEERFLAMIERAKLPRPEVNALVEGFEVDFVWRAQRLIVETDGAATHLTATAFEEDRRRDAALAAAGWRVVRFTWRQVVDRTAERTLRKLLL